MKSYTYPINYTEICPYDDISVLGTGCIRINDSLNRLTLNKLNSKENIIGKKIYIRPIMLTGLPLSSTIISINKNIININPNLTLEPGYTMNSNIGYYNTSYFETYTFSQTYHNNNPNYDIIEEFSGVAPQLCYVYNTPHVMSIAIDFEVRIYLNGKPEPPGNTLRVSIKRSHLTNYDPLINLYLTSDASSTYNGSWGGTINGSIVYGGVDVVLSFFKYVSVPKNSNLRVTILLTIKNIQLYENLCENKLEKSPEGSYLRLIVGYAHRIMIGNSDYYP